MKLSAQEEYGMRCLLRLGSREARTGSGMTIPEISKSEGLSVSHVAKLMRILRIGGLVESVRGHTGGYRLSRPVSDITMDEAITALGGKLYDSSFCEEHARRGEMCTHYIGCSIRPLWHRVQSVIDRELSRITLADILGTPEDTQENAGELLQISGP